MISNLMVAAPPGTSSRTMASTEEVGSFQMVYMSPQIVPCLTGCEVIICRQAGLRKASHDLGAVITKNLDMPLSVLLVRQHETLLCSSLLLSAMLIAVVSFVSLLTETESTM